MKKIIETRYMSTYDFVSTNELEKEAVELFGKEWEAEDDMVQITDLLEHVGAEHFEVMYIEGLRSDYDLEVVFNSDLREIADLKEALKQFIHSVENEGVVNGRVVDAVENAKKLL
jgi:DNA mismatch repair ATPase MutS